MFNWSCDPGQKSMAWNVMGSSEEPTVVLLMIILSNFPINIYIYMHLQFFFSATNLSQRNFSFSGWWAPRKFKTRANFSIGESEGSALDGTSTLTSTLQKREHFF